MNHSDSYVNLCKLRILLSINEARKKDRYIRGSDDGNSIDCSSSSFNSTGTFSNIFVNDFVPFLAKHWSVAISPLNQARSHSIQ